MNKPETTILFTVLNLELPDEIRNVVVTGATAKGFDIEKLVEAYRTVYALGFDDGAVHALNREDSRDER